MTTDKPNSLWLVLASLFLLVIIASSVIIWVRHDRGQPIEISQPPPSPSAREMGAVRPAPGQKIDINLADSWLLEALPGIGTVKAGAIIDYRNQHGPFARTEDILNVPGITSSTFQQIKDLISVD
jgi:competence ComEA-like helix-hairpin-helix protein